MAGRSGAANGAENTTRWADIYTSLISAGHRLADINRYTRRQLIVHYKAADRRDRQQRAEQIENAVLGSHAVKDASNFIAKLRGR